MKLLLVDGFPVSPSSILLRNMWNGNLYVCLSSMRLILLTDFINNQFLVECSSIQDNAIFFFFFDKDNAISILN